ncbi:hypothetical protein [Clostridium sp.]
MATKNLFAKFDKEFDVKGLKEDLKNVGQEKVNTKMYPLEHMR